MANGFIPIRVTNPNILQNFAAGQQIGQQRKQFRQQQDDRETAQAKNLQVEQLMGQVFNPVSSEQLGGQDVGPQLTSDQAMEELFQLNQDLGNQVMTQIGAVDQRKRDDAARRASKILATPPEQQDAEIKRQAQQLLSEGRDPTDTMGLLGLNPEQRRLSLKSIELAALSVKDRLSQGQGLKPTSLMKNIEATGEVRGTPGFQDAVRQQLAKPVGTTVNVGGSGAKKFQEELSRINAKTFGRVTEESDTAIDVNQSLDVLEGIDLDSDALEPAKQALARWGNAFGINTSGLANIQKGEAFLAEAQRMVLAVKSSQKGPQTDKDEVTIRQTVANMGNTPEGNQFIMDSARALNNRRIERKEFYDQYIQDNDGQFKDLDGQSADSAWGKFKRRTPMVSPIIKTPDGLPVFFYQFKELAQQRRPGITDQEILRAWGVKHAVKR